MIKLLKSRAKFTNAAINNYVKSLPSTKGKEERLSVK